MANFFTGVGLKALLMVLPLLMPMVTTAITAWVNSVVGKYVPRAAQGFLSALLGAVVAGLSGAGDAVGVPTEAAMLIGASVAGGAQTYASLHPNTMLSGPPPGEKANG